MIPLIFKRKKTAEFLRQNSGDGEEKKKHGHQPSRPRTLEDNMYGGSATSPSHSVDSERGPGSSLPGGYGDHRQGTGREGGYLSTGGRYYHDYPTYDYPVASRGGQQARRSPSPVGSGEWALRECEAHTTWLNDLRKGQGQPPISDLRTAVADGITLVQLTKALTNSEVSSVEHERQLSRPQAQVNLDRCLAHLAACGVDVIGIQASDLVEGDLRSSLLLLSQIRRRYDGGRSPGHGDPQGKGGVGGGTSGGGGGGGRGGERSSGHPRRPSPDMPGRVDTSPTVARPAHRTDPAGPQWRRVSGGEEDRMIPGVMATDDYSAVSGSHTSLQHQHTDTDRRHFLPYSASSQHASSATSATQRPTPAPKPAQSSLGVTSERPPAQLGVAWAAGSTPKVRQVSSECSPGKGGRGSATVEEVKNGLDNLKVSQDRKHTAHYV